MAVKSVQIDQNWKIEQNWIFDLSDLIRPRRSDLRSLSIFGFMIKSWKMALSMSFSTSKWGMASFDLGGHGGWPRYVENQRQGMERSHAKNEQPRLETVAVKRGHPWLQTPGTNLQLYIKIILCWNQKILKLKYHNSENNQRSLFNLIDNFREHSIKLIHSIFNL